MISSQQLLLLLTAVVLARGCPTNGEARRPQELHCTYEAGGHKIELRLATKPFDQNKHKITFEKGTSGEKTMKIDGEETVGTDNRAPSQNDEEFSEFSVLWDGELKVIDPKLYRQCLNPSLSVEMHKLGWANLKIVVDPKGEWIQLLMFGSDGGGAYPAAWTLRRNGKHERCDPKVFEFSN